MDRPKRGSTALVRTRLGQDHEPEHVGHISEVHATEAAEDGSWDVTVHTLSGEQHRVRLYQTEDDARDNRNDRDDPALIAYIDEAEPEPAKKTRGRQAPKKTTPAGSSSTGATEGTAGGQAPPTE